MSLLSAAEVKPIALPIQLHLHAPRPLVILGAFLFASSHCATLKHSKRSPLCLLPIIQNPRDNTPNASKVKHKKH